MEPQGTEKPDLVRHADLADRRDRDGMAGAGDMLGGAGESPGIGDDREFEPGLVSGHQHDLQSGEPRSDSATTAHPIGDPAAGGGDDFQGYGGAEGNEGA